MPTPNRVLAGQAVPLAAIIFSTSSSCPVPAGYVGYWFDGTTLFKRNADGSDTPQGSNTGAPIFTAVTKTSAPLPACNYNNGPNNDGVGATLTANVNGALGAISGVSLVAGANSPVLVDSQAAPAQNGLYLPTAVGGANAKWVLTRLPGFNTAAEIVDGALVVVQQGTFAGRIYEQTATVATLGTDAVAFAQQSNVALLDTAQTFTAPQGFGVDETINAAGAHPADPAKRTTRYDLATAGNNITSALADGTQLGQRKTLINSSASGGKTTVITPATFADGTTITLTAKFDAAQLEWQAGGWRVIALSGTAAVA